MSETLFISVVAVMALAASGCDSSMEGTVPGDAADRSDATREIVIEASDDLRFDPASIEVQVGEVVTFVVRNTREIDHEFVLGDEAYQDMHEDDMEGGTDMMEMGNAVTVAPDETRVHELIRDLLAAAAKAGEVRDDVTPDELASYCVDALAGTWDHGSRGRSVISCR